MVEKRFSAFDNEAFVVVDNPRGGVRVGSAIINNSNTPVGTVFEFTDGFPVLTIKLDDTSGRPDVFDDDRPGQHVITQGSGIVADGTRVESESYHYVRALDSTGQPTGEQIQITVFSKGGNFTDIWGMVTDTQLQEGVRYVKVGGSNNGDSLYETFVPCFTPGSFVSTAKGLVLVEDLAVGDRVMTRDNGLQGIHWIGRKDLDQTALAAQARLAPICIRKGALGQDIPARDMLVSPNHRMLITGPQLALNFGEEEMLIAAKHLVGLPGIELASTADVSYLHLLCDRHEVLMVDGVWTESFQPGDYTMTGLACEQAEEIFTLFPDLRTGGLNLNFRDARTALRSFEAPIARHAFVA